MHTQRRFSASAVRGVACGMARGLVAAPLCSAKFCPLGVRSFLLDPSTGVYRPSYNETRILPSAGASLTANRPTKTSDRAFLQTIISTQASVYTRRYPRYRPLPQAFCTCNVTNYYVYYPHASYSLEYRGTRGG